MIQTIMHTFIRIDPQWQDKYGEGPEVKLCFHVYWITTSYLFNKLIYTPG